MLLFKEVLKNGKVVGLKTPLTGKDVTNSATLNKGSAFTRKERKELGIQGIIPYHLETIQEQVTRCYEQYNLQPDNLAKYVYMNNLHEFNETLFYRLVHENVEEMLPIIYTPTIGDAVEAFSHEYSRARGVYLSYPNRKDIAKIFDNRGIKDIDIILMSDGEGVLGLGDWAVGTMDICVGKLMVYTACGGLDPRRVLPVTIDVGTNNKTLLKDPQYLGWRNKRLSGKQYDDFIGEIVKVIRRKFPGVFLHWEDFGRGNAQKNLDRYRSKMATFNDDIQGTGATATAALLSGLGAIKQKLVNQKITMYGGGSAGCGVANAIVMAMMQQGLTKKQACARFWMVDRQGLLFDDMKDLTPAQKQYARPASERKQYRKLKSGVSLLDTVTVSESSILVGCSGQFGQFTQQVCKQMAKHAKRPIVFPLSNPTHLSEATPKDIFKWTNGRAIVATGSPFAPVAWKGKKVRISQSNNCFVFPGLGKGIIASKAKRVTDGMIYAACHALSLSSPARKNPSAPVLPDINDVLDVSNRIALAVAKKAREEGHAGVGKNVDLRKRIKDISYSFDYVPIVKGKV